MRCIAVHQRLLYWPGCVAVIIIAHEHLFLEVMRVWLMSTDVNRLGSMRNKKHRVT